MARCLRACVHVPSCRFTGTGYLCIEWVSLMPEDAWAHHTTRPGVGGMEVRAEPSAGKGREGSLRFSDQPYPFNRYLVSASALFACVHAHSCCCCARAPVWAGQEPVCANI